MPNDCVSGGACFPRSTVSDATPPQNRLRCPTAKPCPLNAGLGLAPKPKRTHLKANLQKLKTLLGLANNCGEKPYQNSTSTRFRKQAVRRPAKVHTTERLATRPRLASPLPACSQSPPLLSQHHSLFRPQTRANPAWPQTTTAARSRAALFHRQQSTSPRLSHSAKRLNCPTAATSAARTTAHASPRLSRKPDPAQFSKSLALPTATPPNLLATVQPAIFTTPKSFALATSASFLPSAHFLPLPLAQRGRQRHGVFSQKHC